MTIESAEELAGMRRVGALVGETLRSLREQVRPGIATGTLDEHAAAIFARHGATSAPASTYGFPGTICISVNEEVVHGVPGPRVLREGDLVTLDVTPELDGFFADAAITVPVGRPTPAGRRLLGAAGACLRDALAVATSGARLSAIGRATERTAHRHGTRPFAELAGHGIGRGLHEEPSVFNVDMPRLRTRLHDGLVLAVEPMLTAGSTRLETRDDGWTIATADGSLSVHVEHTIVVRDRRPAVLTG
ncbi:type I methionyl aminopeptidase [Patulibacter defluvii]|uniref:type I methionyl aminopeptidase n=1 Tax=Patulibacter defluvii TaxID=3095358 RepID=UPI002A766932|nr:type I methionyl aminopeptidase [Patulibacter sp. DM4]